MIKGGLTGLLSCFLIVQLSAQSFMVDRDPASTTYGGVRSPELDQAVLASIAAKQLSFTEWSSFFRINVTGSSRFVLGDYSIKENQILFQPRFLPDPGVTYSLSFYPDRLSEISGIFVSAIPVYETISFHRQSVGQTIVQKVSLPSDSIPANILRCYLHFSAPMGFSNPYDFITLEDISGKVVDDAFVEFPEGLWNEDRTRLTLLFHPGRVKRGVGPNMKQGSIFEEGNIYRLVISEDWLDADGNPLEEFSRKIYATSPVRSSMDFEDWTVQTTCEDICEVKLTSDRMVDVEIAKRFISLKDRQEKEIEFELSQEGDMLIISSPAFVKSSRFTILINPRLEDICGNTFLYAFDSEAGPRDVDGKTLILKFETK